MKVALNGRGGKVGSVLAPALETAGHELVELDSAVDTLTGLGFGVSIDLHPGDRLGRLHAAEPDRGS